MNGKLISSIILTFKPLPGILESAPISNNFLSEYLFSNRLGLLRLSLKLLPVVHLTKPLGTKVQYLPDANRLASPTVVLAEVLKTD